VPQFAQELQLLYGSALLVAVQRLVLCLVQQWGLWLVV
jgi:hypothetical protein